MSKSNRGQEQNSKIKLYQRLYKFILNGKENEISTFKDRIITFNYDTLFDLYLKNHFSYQELYFDKLTNSKPSKNIKRKNRFDHPILLKLHGSLNWVCDRSEFNDMLNTTGDNSYYINKIWLKEKGSTIKPGDGEMPLIIPPLPNKPLTKIELFKYLWTKAAEYLSRAEEIVLCGYSLPTTDSLAGSLFGSFDNSKLNSITIIDPSPEILMKWKRLMSRHGIKTKSWAYYSDLNEYLNSNGF